MAVLCITSGIAGVLDSAIGAIGAIGAVGAVGARLAGVRTGSPAVDGSRRHINGGNDGRIGHCRGGRRHGCVEVVVRLNRCLPSRAVFPEVHKTYLGRGCGMTHGSGSGTEAATWPAALGEIGGPSSVPWRVCGCGWDEDMAERQFC